MREEVKIEEEEKRLVPSWWGGCLRERKEELNLDRAS